MDIQLGTTNLAVQDTKFYGNYRGTVLFNTDPLQLGRIKVQVQPMMQNITVASSLPWAIPAYPINQGSGNGTGYFAVPSVNSQVYVFFEEGDIYEPVYFAEAPDGKKGLPTARTTNYPNRKVTTSPGASGYSGYSGSSGITSIWDDVDKRKKEIFPGGTVHDLSDGLLNMTGNISIGSGITGILMNPITGISSIARNGILTDIIG